MSVALSELPFNPDRFKDMAPLLEEIKLADVIGVLSGGDPMVEAGLVRGRLRRPKTLPPGYRYLMLPGCNLMPPFPAFRGVRINPPAVIVYDDEHWVVAPLKLCLALKDFVSRQLPLGTSVFPEPTFTTTYPAIEPYDHGSLATTPAGFVRLGSIPNAQWEEWWVQGRLRYSRRLTAYARRYRIWDVWDKNGSKTYA